MGDELSADADENQLATFHIHNQYLLQHLCLSTKVHSVPL
jgi:hypothetical protein